MCDDHPGISRRKFIHGAAVVGAAAAVGLPRGLTPRLPLRSPARAVAADGTSAYSMAMHIHSSFSEQNGSMAGSASTRRPRTRWMCCGGPTMITGWTQSTTGTRLHFTSLTGERERAGRGRRVELDGWPKQRPDTHLRPHGGIVIHAVLTRTTR